MTLAALDTLQRLALSRRHGPLHADLHQLGVAGDGVEWRAQLVAHDREKLALGAIRLFGQTPGLFRFTPRRALGAEESLPLTERRTQRRLELFTTPDLRFERLRTLLQETDLDQSRALVTLDVPFRRDDVRVLGADRG